MRKRELQEIELQKMGEIISEATRIMELFAQKAWELARKICRFVECLALQYLNRRVLWLGLHHRKKKIRKKNMNRIM